MAKRVVIIHSRDFRLVGTGYPDDGFSIERLGKDALGEQKWDKVGDDDTLKSLLVTDVFGALVDLLHNGVRS